MKLCYFLILGLAISLFSSAQTIDCKVELKSNFIQNPFYIYELRETSSFFDGKNIIQIENPGVKAMKFYTAKYSGQKHALIIRKFDAAGKELLENKVEKGNKNFGPLPAATIQFNNRLLVFYARYEDKDSMKVFLSEIDKNSLALISTKFLFSYAQSNPGLLGMAKLLYRRMIVRKSPGETKLLLVVQGEDEKDYFTCIIGKDLDIIRKKVSTLPVKGKEQVIDAIVEDSGNNILLVQELVGTTSYDIAMFSEMYRPIMKFLIQKEDNTEQFIRYDTILSGLKPCNARFKIAKDGQTLIFGDYIGKSGIDGIWYAKAKVNQFAIESPEIFEYPADFKAGLKSIGFDFNSTTIMSTNFSLVEFDNGDMAICGHPVLKGSGISMRNAMTTNTSYFRAGPLLTGFIDHSTRQCNFSLLPRSINDPVVGEGVFLPYKDKLVILYNDVTFNFIADSLKAKGIKPDKDDYRFLSLGYAVVKKDGSIERKKLLVNRQDLKTDLSTNEFFRVSKNEILIPSRFYDQKHNSHHAALITIY